MIYILAFIVLIGVIVFVHELGHFWAARSVGVGVERFSVGMPPNFIDFTKTKKGLVVDIYFFGLQDKNCLLYTSPSPRDATLSRMPSSA